MATAQLRLDPWYLAGDGGMALEPSTADREVVFTYDPREPTPSPGGAITSLRGGPQDNRAVEKRRDVAVFTSAPLVDPLDVMGAVAAHVHVARDNPHADFFVRLCDVDPNGRSINVCDGIVRLGPGDPVDGIVAVALLDTAHLFARGHRMRVQIAGGAHPPGSLATPEPVLSTARRRTAQHHVSDRDRRQGFSSEPSGLAGRVAVTREPAARWINYHARATPNQLATGERFPGRPE